MSSPATPGQSANSTNSAKENSNTPEKPRLTEQEKKQNHIASEQKRRAAIREGFDRLTDIVPGLQGQARSEGMVLTKVVDFAREKLDERQALIREIEAKGGIVEPGLKK